MINKKNELGKAPFNLGDKDAVHVAIVSVRAATPIEPGTRCGLNDRREAIRDNKGPGIADPFLRATIQVGENFWLVLAQDQVPNVKHMWDHPDVDFSAPTEEVQKNEYLERHARNFGITYKQLMDACEFAADNWTGSPYPGELTEEEVNKHMDRHDIFYEWSDETGYEFENTGSACCPETDYPYELFTF